MPAIKYCRMKDSVPAFHNVGWPKSVSRCRGVCRNGPIGQFHIGGSDLGVTGAAVGKSVSRLEARLGIKLLHRTTRKLTLTTDGEAYLETCLAIIDQLETTEDNLAYGRAVPIGKIRVDLPGAFGRWHIMPILSNLSCEYGRLDFSVMFTERISDIICEGIDLAIRIGRLDDDSGLVAPLGNPEGVDLRIAGLCRQTRCAHGCGRVARPGLHHRIASCRPSGLDHPEPGREPGASGSASTA